MQRPVRDGPQPHVRSVVAAALAAVTLAACAIPPSKDEIEAAQNTYACQLTGERVVLRFDVGEVRLLMPDGNRVTLHQIPSSGGLRYSNGFIELRGKTRTELQFVSDNVSTALAQCEQFPIPKAASGL